MQLQCSSVWVLTLGVQKVYRDREAVTLAVIFQGLLWSSVDSAGSVLMDAISLLVPLCSAAVQTPPWSLHTKLQEILHCRAVEETSTRVSGWPDPASICGGAFCWQNAPSTSRAGCSWVHVVGEKRDVVTPGAFLLGNILDSKRRAAPHPSWGPPRLW